jgi:hypothetical protein
MSEAQKRRMAAKARSTTRDEQECKTMRLLLTTCCPAVSVFSASGAPSTENSFTCEFEHGIRSLWPDCPSYGKVEQCKLFLEFRKRRLFDRFWYLRVLQVNADRFEPKVAGHVGWWSLKQVEQRRLF